MEDQLHTADRRVDAFVAPDVTLDQLDLIEQMGEVLAAPGCEVVEDANLVAAGEQALDEV